MMTEAIWHTVATAHNEALKRGVLNIWTVYDHPADFPDSYVARLFVVGNGGNTPTVTDRVVEAELEVLRDIFRNCGLTCLKRASEDEPQIIESWL